VAAADFAQRHLRRNVLALGADFALFMTGLAMASQTTIVPAFAVHLGASNLVVGAIPAIMTLGWFLPSVFAAGYTETLARRLPFVIRWTIWERVPVLVMGLAAFFLASWAPTTTLVLLLLMLAVLTGVGGLLMPAWLDIVGRAIPVRLRGRFFAVSSAVGNLGGLAASLGVTGVLATVPAPRNYGICFLLSAACLALSFWALLLTREPPLDGEARPAVPLRAYLGRMRPLLARDPNYARFLVARSLAIVGQMSAGFYTVYALHAFAAPEWQAGIFTSVMLTGQVGGGFVLGSVADRGGHRLTLAFGIGAMTLANAVALAAPSLVLFNGVFVLLGLNQAAIHVSAQTILLEFAPTEGDRPTYIGLGNTAMAPVAFVSPFLAALLADTVGFWAVFVVSALFSIAGLALLGLRVHEPRHVLVPNLPLSREGERAG
jgi:MFS family permease